MDKSTASISKQTALATARASVVGDETFCMSDELH